MLLHLHVKNLALIEEAEVTFGPGLNILTGETGAGKSILLGSMQLILGAKIKSGMIRANADSALVELLFDVEDERAKQALDSLGVGLEDGQVILSRRITEGKSINRINGETSTLGHMKEVASVLLDIHGQHEHQSLVSNQRQLEILDAYGKEEIEPAREMVSQAFQKFRAVNAKVKSMDMDAESRSREVAYLEFELSEIEKAQLKPGEDEELEASFKRMSESQTIREALAGAKQLISGEEGAYDGVDEACRLLKNVAGLDAEVAGLAATLEELDALLADFGRDLTACLEGLSFSEEDFYETSQRLDLINSMKSRYGHTIDEIEAYALKQQARLDALLSYEETLEHLKGEAHQAKKELDQACHTLSEKRKRYAKELEERITEGLKDLNFLDVRFSIDFAKRKAYKEDGFDEVTYMISTNPGTPPGPLAEVVSGGELSRIMLAIKAILADRDHIETLIFDEIDTGISGRTAQKVSEKMAVIGRCRQVLCITHLPQIAAMADAHFEITKQVDGELTTTSIRKLEEGTEVAELARLLAGASVTDAVLENAAEMKRLADQTKQRLKGNGLP